MWHRDRITMRRARSLFSCSTELCADSVESHPYIPGLFALGTYQVDQAEVDANLKSKNDGETKGQDDEDDEPASGSSPAYSRRGRCTLRATTQLTSESVDCSILDSFDMAAILDMKWTLSEPFNRPNESAKALGLLGIADAAGHVSLHSLKSAPKATVSNASAENQYHLEQMADLHLSPRQALCLSLDWSDRVGGSVGGYVGYPDAAYTSNDTSLIVSQSDGTLAYLPSLEAALDPKIVLLNEDNDEQKSTIQGDDDSDEVDPDIIEAHSARNAQWEHKPRGLETWHAHDYETWIAAWDCWSGGTIAWSGGDDLKLKGWDVRSSNSGEGRQPTFVCQKGFEGGVTTMQSHHLRQHLWAVGSYDGHVRLFDARSPLRPLSSTSISGGVWRLKWHPSDASQLLVGAMHDGFKVLSLSALAEDALAYSREEMECVARFDEHDSLAYGCDWDRGRSAEFLVNSCSFYDAKLHSWRSA